jgi:hypothetical protein
MKKMMVLAAALLVAAMSQAGSIDWSISGRGAIKGTDGKTSLSGATVYLVLVSDQAKITDALVNGGDFASLTLGSGTLTETGALTPAVAAQSAKLTAGTAYDYAVLVFNDYTKEAGKTGNYKFSTSLNDIANPDGDHTQFATFAAANFTGATWNAYTVVPEPTCMALLALGAVAFGLRRKIRK